MKYGVRIKLDVTKIDKALLYQGKKGTYLDATCFMDADNPGEYGDHGFVSQDISKERREAGDKGEIIGNVEVFWRGESQGQRAAPAAPQQQMGAAPAGGQADAPFEDDIPFNCYERGMVV